MLFILKAEKVVNYLVEKKFKRVDFLFGEYFRNETEDMEQLFA